MTINKSFKTEEEFWKQFVELFNSFTTKNKKLTDKEIDILSVVLSFNVDTKFPFKGIKRKQIKEKLGIAEQTLAMHKKNIEEKGWLLEGRLNKQLQTMYEFIKSNGVEAKLSININIDESL